MLLSLIVGCTQKNTEVGKIYISNDFNMDVFQESNKNLYMYIGIKKTKEEKIDVKCYFEDELMTITRITLDCSEIVVINDRYTNLDNEDISIFGLQVGLLDECGETYHVTITGDRENGLSLHFDKK